MLDRAGAGPGHRELALGLMASMTEGMSEDELATLHQEIALAALKFFILKVEPKKGMVYNPVESVSLNGDTVNVPSPSLR